MRLKILTEDDIKRIHAATLKVLREVGVRFEGTRARKILVDNGCQIKGERVVFPENVVEKALRGNPSSFKLYSWDLKESLEIGGGETFVRNGGSYPWVFDYKKNLRRKTTSQDMKDIIRLIDGLDNLNPIAGFFSPLDVPPRVIWIYAFYALLSNTRKPIFGPGLHYPYEIEAIIEIISVLLGDRKRLREKPIASFPLSPISPLLFPENLTETIRICVEAGLPIRALPCPISGATAPITLAGTLVQSNAENLATIIYAAMIDKNVPKIYCSRISPMNLMTARPMWGSPDVGIASACSVQMASFYGLPSDVYGLCTSSNFLDMQSGYERMFNLLLPFTAGADIISCAGAMGDVLMGSFEQVVIDNEIAGMAKKLRREISVSDESIGLDAIRNATSGGTFLTHAHTIDNLRTGEVYMPSLSSRASWEELFGKGLPDIRDLAREKAEKILKAHEVTSLPESKVEEIERIIERVAKAG